MRNRQKKMLQWRRRNAAAMARTRRISCQCGHRVPRNLDPWLPRPRRISSHNLVLGQAPKAVRLHVVSPALVEVLDKAEVERATSVLIPLELGNGGLGSLGTVEANHAGASRSTTGLILDLGLLNLANSREQFDQVVVAGGPRELVM